MTGPVLRARSSAWIERQSLVGRTPYALSGLSCRSGVQIPAGPPLMFSDLADGLDALIPKADY